MTAVRRRGQQDENQHVVKVGQETQPGRLAFFSGSALGPRFSNALRPRRSAILGATVVLRQHLFNGLLVGGVAQYLPQEANYGFDRFGQIKFSL
jgi:hypothetical protein